MKDLAPDVWPEFFQFVGQAVVQDEKSERARVS